MTNPKTPGYPPHDAEDPAGQTQQEMLVRFYQSLPEAERTERLRIEPYYPEVRDEIVEPDKITVQTWYFWRRWAPKLGPVATALFIRLRMHCYYNRKTGEVRDFCYPSQKSLAEEIGCRDKKTVMAALKVLEDHGFVRREAQYRYDAETRKKVRTTDRYRILMTDPVAQEDEGDLIVRMAERITADQAVEPGRPHRDHLGPKNGLRSGGVDNSGPKSVKRTQVSGPKNGQEEVLLRVTSNVETLGQQTTVHAVPPDADFQHDYLAVVIGDQLKTMAGTRTPGDHRSAGFHRRVALLMPEHLIQEALTATRDAVDDERGGRKELRAGPAAYFAGIVRRIAEREGIDLGVEWKPKRGPTTR